MVMLSSLAVMLAVSDDPPTVRTTPVLVLVVTPVSSSGLCGNPGEESLKVVAAEAPVERSGGGVVTGFERGELIGQDVEVRKVVGGEQLSLYDREVDLDLVEPGGRAPVGGSWSRSETRQ